MLWLMVYEAAIGNGPASFPELRANRAHQHNLGWPKKVAQARGPFGAFAASLYRIGWESTFSPILVDTGARASNILELGPVLVPQLALEPWRQRLQQKAAKT